MNDFMLIANPISGKGTAKKVAEQAYTALTSTALHGTLELTSAAGDAKRFAHEAISDRTKWVIACGGDGTLHEVVNGIANAPNVTLGVLPCGRGNDFAAAIGVPTQPEAAIKTLTRGTPIHVDLGHCYQTRIEADKSSLGLPQEESKRSPRDGVAKGVASPTPSRQNAEEPLSGHYFTTIATCGYDTEVSRRAAKGPTLPGWAGPLFAGTAAYAAAAVETLFDYEPPDVRIVGDFGVHEGPILLAATGITKRYGGGFQIVPNARINDGLFDVCIIRPVSRISIIRLLVTLFWGGHVSHPAVSIHQTRTLTVFTQPPLLLYADGEPMCQTPATIEIIKQGLTVLAPSL